jgi:uncharacterized protein (TIGR03083 family)
VQPDVVLALYDEGLEAVDRVVDGWSADQWLRPACGSWSGGDVAGHLVCVVGWYHEWLDRALEGESRAAFTADQLSARNQEALDSLRYATETERVAQFQAEARRYAQRLPGCWDIAYGYPYGTVTVGLHIGAAAAEWHLHAWDLATAAGQNHRPSDPHTLFLATATCMLAAQGGLRARLGAKLVPGLAKRDPWNQLLRRSGRRPSAPG